MEKHATVVVEQTYDGREGYAAYVRMVGSARSCASFFASTQISAIDAAIAWCAKYDLIAWHCAPGAPASR